MHSQEKLLLITEAEDHHPNFILELLNILLSSVFQYKNTVKSLQPYTMHSVHVVEVVEL